VQASETQGLRRKIVVLVNLLEKKESTEISFLGPSTVSKRKLWFAGSKKAVRSPGRVLKKRAKTEEKKVEVIRTGQDEAHVQTVTMFR